MTDTDFRLLAPAFSRWLAPLSEFVGEIRVARNLDAYCRGLLSDEPRKSVEPLALRAGLAVRSLQCFLKHGDWDHLAVKTALQKRIIRRLEIEPDLDGLGTIGIFDETSALKKGTKTPGVQRQYLGCAGKLDNGIVTVHFAVSRGRLKALIDTDLFLPESWANDRERCEEADVPDDVSYKSKWVLAWQQYIRARDQGLRCDWLCFDSGYAGKPNLLRVLDVEKQKFVGEVPKNFSVTRKLGEKGESVLKMLPSKSQRGWKRLRLEQATGGETFWWYRSKLCFVKEVEVRVIVMKNRRTKEVKYLVSNAVKEAVQTLIRVNGRRWSIEHLFRISKSEVGLMHYEGRSYIGLIRHQILCMVTLGFVSIHTAELQKKRERDDGAVVWSAERDM
jgi:SRSO17 transposase